MAQKCMLTGKVETPRSGLDQVGFSAVTLLERFVFSCSFHRNFAPLADHSEARFAFANGLIISRLTNSMLFRSVIV
jgi:hypothetical protein